MPHAIIYTQSERKGGLKLPILLLEEEGIGYEIRIIKPQELIIRSKGRVAFGWIVELSCGTGSATNWKQLYCLLAENGLFRV